MKKINQHTPLTAAFEDKLRQLLSEAGSIARCKVKSASGLGERGFDLVATVSPSHGQDIRFYVQCKAEPRPSLFPISASRPLPKGSDSGRAVAILAAPFISPRMAELCRQYGWGWYDLAGNCRLSVPGSILIERTGFSPVKQASPPRANLSTPHAARVIRALLALDHTGMEWTQSSLMNHITRVPPQAPVSIGLVNKVVRHLKEEAYVEDVDNGKFKLRDPLGLLTAWKSAYRFDRHVRRSYFTLLQGIKLQEALAGLASITEGHAIHMGFSATSYVRQHRVWLYLGAEYEKDFQQAVEAKLVDSGENLVVLLPDDPGVFYGQETGEGRLPSTNPMQTYVDLFHCGGRGDDAAEALLNHRMKPEWKLRGLLREP